MPMSPDFAGYVRLFCPVLTLFNPCSTLFNGIIFPPSLSPAKTREPVTHAPLTMQLLAGHSPALNVEPQTLNSPIPVLGLGLAEYAPALLDFKTLTLNFGLFRLVKPRQSR
jgi:hypothetical protein